MSRPEKRLTGLGRNSKPQNGLGRVTRQDSRTWLFFALALTFFMRLWFILGMRGNPFSTVGPQMLDSYYYHRWAIEIISGNFWGSDVFFLRPLYPYLLALIYAVFGRHVFAVQFIQTVLATISCLLLYETTRHVFGRRPAIFASFGFALNGILVFYTGTLLYVEITVLLSLLFLWLLLIAGKRIWLWIAAGVCFGLLVVCRPELLPILPFTLLWLWRRQTADRQPVTANRALLNPTHSPEEQGRTWTRGPAALTVAALVVIAVVPIRNYVVARDPVLFTAHSGINFYYGNNASADGTWQPTAELERGPGFSHERLKRVSRTINGRELSWSAASAYWTKQGLSFITHQPLTYFRLLGRKLLLFLSNYEVPNDYYPETARAASLPLRLAFVNLGLVLGLGLLGMIWAWPKRRQALPAYLFVAAYLLSSFLFYVLSRLRAPVIPFLLMFAGFGLNELVGAYRQRRLVRAATGLAIAVAAYLGSGLIPVQRQTYSAQAWTQVGNTFLSERKIGPAIDALTRALTVQPNSYAARYSLVMALAGAGKTDQAEAEFSELAKAAASSSEGQALARLAAARIAIARRDFAQAAALYRQDLAQYPDDAETCYMLGLVYISMDSLAQAREQLSRAVAIDPGQDAARDALKAVESRLQH
ncbi:MAG TPA: tetratricopeptide repeat protein [bacterium]|nr:tetratricopeptide repeat protein [bacterium]